MEKWFICQNEKVTGPFSTDEIKAQYAGAQIPADCLIWGRGLSQWQTIEWWSKEASNINFNPVVTTIATQTTTRTENVSPSQQQWHYAIDGASKGPMTRVELINELRLSQDKTQVLVWTKGMKTWANLYDFQDLVDELGLNRRQHPRVGITGNIVVKTDDNTYIGLLKTISQGGFGASQLNHALSIGQSFSVEIKSEELGDTVTAKAVVQYITNDSFYGCQFQTINMESRARITEYILRAKQNSERAA